MLLLDGKAWSDSELFDFFVVILAIEDIPFLRAFQDCATLTLDLLTRCLVDFRLLSKHFFQYLARLLADSVAIFQEFHVLHGRQYIGHGMGQLVHLFAADAFGLFALDPHSTALYLRTNSFLILLNIS